MPDTGRAFIARGAAAMRQLRRAPRSLAALAVVLVVLVSARHAMRSVDPASVWREMAAIPLSRLGVAVLLTAASYASLGLLELLALRFAGSRLSPARAAFTALGAYSLSHALGFPALTGGAVRFRLYSAWGVEPSRIVRVVAFNALSFWVGVLCSVGIVLPFFGVRVASLLRVSPVVAMAVGASCLAAVLCYLCLTAVRGAHRAAPRAGMTLPSFPMAAAQTFLSVLDWAIAGMVLVAVIPAGSKAPVVAVLGAFLLGHVAGLVSHVPAGLGVFEATVVILLAPWLPTTTVLAAVIAYRTIYYVAPLAVSAGLLATHEGIARRASIRGALRRIATAFAAAESSLVPAVLAMAVFVAGAVLLFSGATPPIRARMDVLHDVSPTPVIEGAYFLASLTGVALLLTARGLWRRVDGARVLAIALLAAGVVLSLLKGLDYEESAYLALVLGCLVPARRCFPRRAALLAVDFSPRWLMAIGIVVASSVWLLFFSYERVLFAGGVWWHFTVAGGASRALRATVGAAVVAAMAAIARLLRPVQPLPPLPEPADIALAARIIARSPETFAHLALLGDKALLFNDAGTAFLMYGVSGQSWVAMGDPVGPVDQRASLARRFRELAARHGGRAVFYQGSPAALPLYVELGLTPFKLGESARVALDNFSLKGGSRKWLRRARKAAIEAGCSFEVVPADEVHAILPALRAVSDAWLAGKRAREKGFSLGYYDEAYLQRHPIAVVRHDGKIVAFANLWLGDRREELSLDLMRYTQAAPPGVTDYLLSELLLWGRDSGYHWFDLGMAPLSGLEQRQFAPLWNRIGGFVYRRGNSWYNFQGLRQFKEKFDPVWEPRYLAARGSAGAAAAVTDVTALVSRGSARAVRQ